MDGYNNNVIINPINQPFTGIIQPHLQWLAKKSNILYIQIFPLTFVCCVLFYVKTYLNIVTFKN